MVRFSRREDYAVILVTTLAEHYSRGLISLSEVAKSYKLSLLFLRNVANDLRNKSIVKAVEGKKGGYKLSKNPKDLKMGEVLKAFSTEALLSCCSAFSVKGKCPQEGFCRTGYIWRKLNREFLERISSLSVLDFMHYK
ncbi:MAG: Rrf2 family transcriptional regulator [Candidatus Levyibacteriota bacterium]|nr:MAG: Rrf2 family transcriptional regulator [Candidatus Levybacteria bacterium]